MVLVSCILITSMANAQSLQSGLDIFASTASGSTIVDQSIIKNVTPAQPLTDTSKATSFIAPELNVLDPRSSLYGKVVFPNQTPLDLPNIGFSENISSNTVNPLVKPTHMWFGTYINNNNVYWAVFATQQVQLNLNLNGMGQSLYAPTLCGPNHCPLEASTWYYTDVNELNTNRYFGVFDHDKGYYVVQIPMTTTFSNTYVRFINGETCYQVEIYKDNYGWQVILYNFLTQKWDKLLTNPETQDYSSNTYGWDVCEPLFNGPPWQSLPHIESMSLQVENINVFHNVDSSYGSNYVSNPYPYTKNWVSNYYDWYTSS